jgi:hypothetical protein
MICDLRFTRLRPATARQAIYAAIVARKIFPAIGNRQSAIKN